MTKAVHEMLADGKEIFDAIDKLKDNNRIPEIYKIISETMPPQSWLVKREFGSQKIAWYSVNWDIMEAAIVKIFGAGRIGTISHPLITQHSSGVCAVTIRTIYECQYFKNLHMPWVKLPGVATEVVHSINDLPRVVPLTSTLACKNGIKQLGALFGKYLNRESDTKNVMQEDESVELTHDEMNDNLRKGIDMVQTTEELDTYKWAVAARGVPEDIRNMYKKREGELNSGKK